MGDVRVTPTPEHLPKLYLGGMAEPAIDRAARIADGFLSTGGIGHDVYLDRLARNGRAPDDGVIIAGHWAIISDDPEREAATVGPHVLYQGNQYIEWGAFGPPETMPRFPDAATAIANGLYELWDADTAVTRLIELLRKYPQIRDLHFWAQFPGEPVASGQRRIEYVAKHVLPRVRAALSSSSVTIDLRRRVGCHAERVWTVIAVNARARCKTRLDAALGQRRRSQLARRMLGHVLEVARSVPAIDTVLVVSPERDSIPRDVMVLRDRVSISMRRSRQAAGRRWPQARTGCCCCRPTCRCSLARTSISCSTRVAGPESRLLPIATVRARTVSTSRSSMVRSCALHSDLAAASVTSWQRARAAFVHRPSRAPDCRPTSIPLRTTKRSSA